MIVAAIAVKLESSGPILYRQPRLGQNGCVFILNKFRSMRHDAEKDTGPVWTTQKDSRVTRVGALLRRTRLDELPQLFNVLRGEMSLVGPRPERPEIVQKLREVVVGYDRRHMVKPGITGFAQIHLPPDSCVRSVRNKLVYDLFYVRHRCVRMELFVLLATGLKMLGLKRLYYRAPRVPTE
jgi:lipopolysaccharide/colanic/teichoic acid biosynthesis glycosyltransferase